LKRERRSLIVGKPSREAKVVQMWLSVDPLAEVYPTISPYAYVANNPIAFVDPDGKRIKPWKTTYSFFGIKWTIYHGLTDINNADKKFDKSYSSLMKSSNVFRTAIARLKKSNRDYEFRTIYKKSGSTENRGKYGSFNPDDNSINFVVDLSSSDAYTGRKSTVFEEVFHAAQIDYLKDKKESKSMLAIEVEAKLAKSIEGLSGHPYETLNVDASIIDKIKNKMILSANELSILTTEIDELSRRVAKQYELDPMDFYGGDDLKYIESIYGQKLTNQQESITITYKKD